jgi:hypothetical protein
VRRSFAIKRPAPCGKKARRTFSARALRKGPNRMLGGRRAGMMGRGAARRGCCGEGQCGKDGARRKMRWGR